MTFLKTVEKKWKVTAVDGPDHNASPHGASNPENWVSKLQSGKNATELKEDAQKLHDIVTNWQETALEANHLYAALAANGGRYFEMHSPLILKGMSREKLLNICEICSKIALKAPTV